MSAKAERLHFGVGLVTIIVVVVFLSIIGVIAEPYYFSPKIVTETYFTDSINGLEVGNPVKFRGVPVGEIIKIGLTSDLYPQDNISTFESRESLAVVRMRLYFPKDLFTEQLPKYIAEGLRTQTELAGLTGTLYVSLDFLEPSRYPARRHPYPWTPDYPVIPSAPSLTNEILDSLENFLASLSSLNLDSKFKDTMPAIQALVLQLDKLAAGFTGDVINQLLTNTDNLIKTADKQVQDVDAKKINALIKELNGTATHLTNLASGPEADQLAQKMNDLANKFNNIATGNDYNIRTLLTSMLQVTQGLASLTRQLNNNPAFFLEKRASSRLPDNF